jgi:hypothetical protein
MEPRSRIKRSRVYLEEVWLPRLGARPPVLDIGKADYTAHYGELVQTAQYVTVDIDAARAPDIVADVTSPAFVAQAREHHAEYGTIVFNGVIGYGIDAPGQVEASLRHFHLLLRRGGQLLIGWNEWSIDREMLAGALRGQGFENLPIEGEEVFEPVETEGYERLKHRYTCWQKT